MMPALLTVACCLVAEPAAPAATMTAAPGERLSQLEVMQPEAPQAFFFRSSEGMAANPRMPFARWETAFERLMGIEGKVLDEEIPGRSATNVRHFTRFKQRHPRQLVLLHFNGNARDPRFSTESYSAGHWLYYNGSRISRDLPAEAGESVIAVEHPELFLTNIGRFRRDNEDIGLCQLDATGRPDWHHSEQVQLISVDVQRKTIRVRRGCFGSKPIALSANKAYAAAHVTEGPWGGKSHLLWAYNYSTSCPRDARRRQARDILIEELAGWFARNGPLHAFDGLEFDVLHDRPLGGGRRGADCDADGRPDRGSVGGVNVYGTGVIEFLRLLRQRLGDDRLILADGHSPRGQRGFRWLNGIESEGFPSLSDHSLSDWSGGLNRHAFWAANGHAPIWNYINHKFVTPGERPGQVRRAEVPFSAHRLVFAAAAFTDAAVCYSTTPAAEPGELIGIWDELQAGRDRQKAWLGRPRGPAVHRGVEEPDLLQDRWQAPFGSADRRLAGVKSQVTADAAALELRPAGDLDRNVRFQVAPVVGAAGQLLVRAALSSDPLPRYPATRARLVTCSVSWGRSLVAEHPERSEHTGMQLRGGGLVPIDPASGATVGYSARQTLGGRTMEGYRVHPPYKPRGSVGMTFWQCTAQLPDDPYLLVHTGMGPLAPERSDGVVFEVLVAASDKLGRPATSADWQPVLKHLQTASHWQRHAVSLKSWAGENVTLRFVADCGPHDNATTDHAYWGGVQLGTGTPPAELQATQRLMTWANERPFTSYFFFDHLPAGPLTLELQVEGQSPVRVHQLTAHAAAEVVYRQYEHGLVVANLGRRPVQLPLTDLVPGEHYRRIRGSKGQDPETNNGMPVTGTLVVPPRDALFLLREQAR